MLTLLTTAPMRATALPLQMRWMLFLTGCILMGSGNATSRLAVQAISVAATTGVALRELAAQQGTVHAFLPVISPLDFSQARLRMTCTRTNADVQAAGLKAACIELWECMRRLFCSFWLWGQSRQALCGRLLTIRQRQVGSTSSCPLLIQPPHRRTAMTVRRCQPPQGAGGMRR